MDYLHILTVVRNVPKVNSFRPSPDGEVTSKASIASLEDVDYSVFSRRANLSGSIPFNVASTKLYFTGPCWSPCRLSSAKNTNYGRKQTVDKNDPMYSGVFGLAVWAAFFHIFNNSTSAADRNEIIHKLCQMGLDLIQSGTANRNEYWPSHNAVSWHAIVEMTAVVCDNTAVRAAYNTTRQKRPYHPVLRQGSNWSQNGAAPGTGNKTDFRVIDASDIYFRTPARGLQSSVNPHRPTQCPFIADQNPGQTPYTGGFIGFPNSGGSGNPNEGYSADHNMRYKWTDRINIGLVGMVACLRGTKRNGRDVLEWYVAGAADRIWRMHKGHHDGTWRIGVAPEWETGVSWAIWQNGWVNLYQHVRGLPGSALPWWLGRPEQPFPPSVSRSGSGIKMDFHKYRQSNNGPLTGAQYRLRRIKTSNVSGSWQNNNELRNLVFNNTAAWNSPVNMSPAANSVTASGLSSGVWQVQWRLQNASGWGPWSTNCSYYYDERAGNGWPAGPRAVILV